MISPALSLLSLPPLCVLDASSQWLSIPFHNRVSATLPPNPSDTAEEREHLHPCVLFGNHGTHSVVTNEGRMPNPEPTAVAGDALVTGVVFINFIFQLFTASTCKYIQLSFVYLHPTTLLNSLVLTALL